MLVCHRDVLARRAGKDKGHAELKAKFRIDVLSVAAYSHPILHDGDYEQPAARDQTRDLLELSVMASQLEAEVGGLSALGCGAFGHPPRKVAALRAEFLKH
jgi:hypothetical protein